MDTRPVTATLEALADQAVAARIPGDLWQRGRRHRRMTRIRAALAAVAAVSLVAVAVPGVSRTSTPLAPQSAEPPVPAKIHLPYPWQQSARLSPPGPASVVVGFDTESGGRFTGFEIALVGTNGVYRMLPAGHRPLLSPDGSRVAYSPLSPATGVALVDLTGDRAPAQYHPEPGRLWTPVAWTSDGQRLAVFESSLQGNDAILLMDAATGDTRELARSGPYRLPIAFSPDGKHLAVQVAQALSVIDVETGIAQVLPTSSRLAGPGAWSPDGTRLAVVRYDGCSAPCTSEEFNDRIWHVGSFDLRTSTETSMEYRPITDFAVEVIGWKSDGNLVAVSHTARLFGELSVDREFISNTTYVDAQDGNVARTRVLEWRPADRPVALIELAEDIRYVDIPRELMVDGRFGGPSPEPSFWPLTGIWLTGFLGLVVILVLIIAAAITTVVIVRQRGRETAASHS